MTGPVIFADEIARQQLVENGEVVTFRRSDRTTGATWWRVSRTGAKQGDCHIEELGVIPPDRENLRPFVDLSGFGGVGGWRDAIAELNGGLPEEGHLYRVTLPEVVDT